MINFFIFFLLSIQASLAAQVELTESAPALNPLPSVCGEYLLSGVIRKRDNEYQIIVHEKTQSQLRISAPFFEQVKLGMLLDKNVLLRAIFLEEFIGPRGRLDSITQFPVLRIANPLNHQDTGFKLIKEMSCAF